MKNRSLMVKQLMQVAIFIFITIATLITVGIIFSGTIRGMADSFKKDSYESSALVLNADRDIYQSYTGYNAAMLQVPGTNEYKTWYGEFVSNIGDVKDRMGKVQAIVDNNPDLESLRNPTTNVTIKQDMDTFIPAFEAWTSDADSILKQFEKSKDAASLRKQSVNDKVLFDKARSEMNSIGETLALYPDVLANKHISEGNFKQNLIYVVAGCVLIFAFIIYVLNLRKLISKLGALAQKQSHLAMALRQASEQLAAAGQQLSQGSNEQAASIEETSASMEETLSMVKQNVENTRQTRDLSEEASDSSNKGSVKMAGMNSSMEELKRSSNEISKIINVIDEIAFQTNILALNAAVEAARAGDAGLGFAVVAEEVRNLAQRSAQAAKDTAGIIEKNIELSDKGLTVSRDVNISLDEISAKTRNVNQLVAEIDAASKEQERGISQVTEAISEMEKVIQQNAATAEESAATAEELTAQAEELENVVIELNELLKGSKADEMPAQSNSRSMNNKSYNTSNYSSVPTRYMRSEKSSFAKKENNISKKSSVSPSDVIPLDEEDDF